MKIDHIKLPPVSQKFYERLVSAFPPLDPLDIKKDTSMIEIQRSAAQQEVLYFIKQAVVKESNPPKDNIWNRFKDILNK